MVIMSSIRKIVMAASVANEMDFALLIDGSITPAARQLWMAPDLLRTDIITTPVKGEGR